MAVTYYIPQSREEEAIVRLYHREGVRSYENLRKLTFKKDTAHRLQLFENFLGRNSGLACFATFVKSRIDAISTVGYFPLYYYTTLPSINIKKIVNYFNKKALGIKVRVVTERKDADRYHYYMDIERKKYYKDVLLKFTVSKPMKYGSKAIAFLEYMCLIFFRSFDPCEGMIRDFSEIERGKKKIDDASIILLQTKTPNHSMYDIRLIRMGDLNIVEQNFFSLLDINSYTSDAVLNLTLGTRQTELVCAVLNIKRSENIVW